MKPSLVRAAAVVAAVDMVVAVEADMAEVVGAVDTEAAAVDTEVAVMEAVVVVAVMEAAVEVAAMVVVDMAVAGVATTTRLPGTYSSRQ